MKCYTVSHGKLTSGICTNGSSELNECVCLGTCEENSHLAILQFYFPNPPEIVTEADGSRKVFDAHHVQPKGCDFFTLAKPNNPADMRILVRVAHCEFQVRLGSATEIGFGFGTNDKEVLSECWYDSVVVLTPGTVLLLKPLCGTMRETYVLEYTLEGKLRLAQHKSFVARMRHEARFVGIEGMDLAAADEQSELNLLYLDGLDTPDRDEALARDPRI